MNNKILASLAVLLLLNTGCGVSKFAFERLGLSKSSGTSSSGILSGVAPGSDKGELTLRANFQICRESVKAILELRSFEAPYDLVSASEGSLRVNDTVFSFSTIDNDTPYYLIVKSANSLETWSAQAIVFKDNRAEYNFSDSISQAYGNNMVLAPSGTLSSILPANGRPSIYQGDSNQDGIINQTDVGMINDDILAHRVRLETDLTCDGVVNYSDREVAVYNMNSLVHVIRP